MTNMNRGFRSLANRGVACDRKPNRAGGGNRRTASRPL